MTRRTILTTLAVLLVLAPSAGATVTAVPLSDPLTPVSQGQPLATVFTTDTAATVDLAQGNYQMTVQTSDGSKCPSVSIRRGTSRFRCTLPAGGSVLYGSSALAATTYHSAYVGGSVAASVPYLTTPTPFVPTVYVIHCYQTKTWGAFVMPSGCI